MCDFLFSPGRFVTINDPHNWYNGRIGIVFDRMTYRTIDGTRRNVYTIHIPSEVSKDAFISLGCAEDHIKALDAIENDPYGMQEERERHP